MIERALPPDDRPADPDASARERAVPTGRRVVLDDDDAMGEAAATDEAAGTPEAADGDAADAIGPAGAVGATDESDESDEASATAGARDADEAEPQGGPGPSRPPRGDGSDCPRPLAARVEAMLFASGRTLGATRIGRALNVETALVQAALEELAAAWKAREGAVELAEIGGGYRFLTRPEFHEDVALLRPGQGPERLSPAALETLAVVAYRQPIARADVEAVRGVQAGPLLRLLQERDLIRIAGRSSEPGHPLLYGTTRRFLDHFGLKSLKALPDLKDLLESA
jgi:segregation and condensation protein B